MTTVEQRPVDTQTRQAPPPGVPGETTTGATDAAGNTAGQPVNTEELLATLGLSATGEVKDSTGASAAAAAAAKAEGMPSVAPSPSQLSAEEAVRAEATVGDLNKVLEGTQGRAGRATDASIQQRLDMVNPENFLSELLKLGVHSVQDMQTEKALADAMKNLKAEQAKAQQAARDSQVKAQKKAGGYASKLKIITIIVQVVAIVVSVVLAAVTFGALAWLVVGAIVLGAMIGGAIAAAKGGDIFDGIMMGASIGAAVGSLGLNVAAIAGASITVAAQAGAAAATAATSQATATLAAQAASQATAQALAQGATQAVAQAAGQAAAQAVIEAAAMEAARNVSIFVTQEVAKAAATEAAKGVVAGATQAAVQSAAIAAAQGAASTGLTVGVQSGAAIVQGSATAGVAYGNYKLAGLQADANKWDMEAERRKLLKDVSQQRIEDFQRLLELVSKSRHGTVENVIRMQQAQGITKSNQISALR